MIFIIKETICAFIRKNGYFTYLNKLGVFRTRNQLTELAHLLLCWNFLEAWCIARICPSLSHIESISILLGRVPPTSSCSAVSLGLNFLFST